MPFDPNSAMELLKNAPKGTEINVNESGVPSVRFDPSGVQADKLAPMESIKGAVQEGAAAQVGEQMANPQARSGEIAAGALQYGLPIAAGLAFPPSAFAFLGAELAPVASVLTNAAVTGLSSFGADALRNDKSLDDMVRDGVSAATWDAAFGVVAPVAGRALARGLLRDSSFKPLTALDDMGVSAGEVLKSKGMELTPDMRPDASPLAKFVGGYLRGSTRESAKFAQDNATKLAAIGEVYSGMLESVGTKTDNITLGNSIRAMLLGPTEESTGRIVSGGMDRWIDQTKTAFYGKAEEYYAGKVKVLFDKAEELLNEMARFKDTDEIGGAWDALNKAFNLDDAEDVPIEALIQAKRDVNAGIRASKGKQGRFKGLSGASDRINTAIYDALQTQAGDDAVAAFATAETFSATSKAVHEQALARSIVTKLKNNPSSLGAFMLEPKKLPDALDQLERVWNLGTSGFEGLSPKGVAKLPSFEDGVKKPLRYLMLADAMTEQTGAFNPVKAAQTFEKYPLSTKLRLFGTADVETWNKVVNAGTYLTDAKMVERMVPKMMESGLFATAMFSGLSGNPAVAGSAAKSLVAIGMSAAGLGRLFRNPKFAANVLDGVLAGPASSRYVTAMQNLVSAGIAEMSESGDGGEFYMGTPEKMVAAKEQRAQEMQALQARMAQDQAQGAQGFLGGGQGGMPTGP